MLTVLSSSIAILGLLLSSPAVIIGAMLISPLMNPIILFGFSLTTLDYRLVLRSLAAIALGTVLAVGQAALIVWLSPLQSITPEILSRTNPNLFDLLVAIFSAIAGAYAVSVGKGETIVGVAIATALMPPLAVVGFGLATGNWAIFDGAGGLFMTNLLAIGLTASMVAMVLGFGSSNSAHAPFWQAVGIVAVFTVLSIPLGLSLKRIASEAVRTSEIRSTLQDYFASSAGRVFSIEVSFPADRPVQVGALVVVRKATPSIEANLERLLREKLKAPVRLSLSQVSGAPTPSLDEEAITELIHKAELPRTVIPVQKPAPDMARTAALETGIPVLDVSVDTEAKRVVLRTGDLTPGKLAGLRTAYASLTKHYPRWSFAFRLDTDTLPTLQFAQGSAKLNENAQALLADIGWFLNTSQLRTVRAVGYADTIGGSRAANRRMAHARAMSVANALKSAGISAAVEARYPVDGQPSLERENGEASFRRVEIVPEAG